MRYLLTKRYSMMDVIALYGIVTAATEISVLCLVLIIPAAFLSMHFAEWLAIHGGDDQ